MAGDMVDATPLRLRRVRFKDGRTLEVFRPKKTSSDTLKQNLSRWVKFISDAPEEFSGYAIVTWHKDGTSVCELGSDGRIPSVLVPDFVRNRLLAQKIEEWTIDTINGD